jgi:hypothetical protein
MGHLLWLLPTPRRKSKRKAAVEEKYAKLRAEAAQGGGAVETPPEPTPGVAADTSDAA